METPLTIDDWKQRAEAAEAKYQDDLNAAALIVLGAGGITGHADTFHSLTAEWVDRMKAAEAKLARIGALVGKWRRSLDGILECCRYGTNIRAVNNCADELRAELEKP